MGSRTNVAVQNAADELKLITQTLVCVLLCSSAGDGVKKEEEDFGADMMASARRLELARRRLHQRRAAGAVQCL